MSQKHVVITGASSGFGADMTKLFLERGWIVHATSRKGELAIAGNWPLELQKNLHVYAMDLNSDESCRTFTSRVLQKTNTLDVLINNAGYGLFGALEDLSEAQIKEQMQVNFIGPAMLTQAFLPALRASKGHMICFSSLMGFSAFPLSSLYCASKFAIEGWAEALKYELAPHGVKVTVVQPGAHRTQFGFNVQWGKESFNCVSAYTKQSGNYRRLLEKMRTRPVFAKPEGVAQAVCKIAGSANPPFRLQLGKDVRATYFMRRVIPVSFFMKLSDRLYRRLFLATPTAG